MKKLSSLILFLTCLGFSAIQAQGIYITGNVTDNNGNPVTDIIGYLEYEDCNNVGTDTIYVDSLGYYEYFLENTCTQGSVLVSFYCQNGNGGNEAQGFYNPGVQTIVLDVVLDCGITNPPDSCSVSISYTPSDFTPWWSFTADAGVLPANTTYTWTLSGGATILDPDTQNSNQVDIEFPEMGTYTICANVMDLTSGDIICSHCITIDYTGNGGNSCDVIYSQGDSLNNDILEAYVTGGTAPYTYEWIVNGNVVGNNQVLDLSNTSGGTYNICVLVTGADGLTCEYCDDVTIGGQNECWTLFEIYSTASGDVALQAWSEGPSPSYTYEWLVGIDTTLITATGDVFEFANLENGIYYVCLTTTGINGEVCEYCETVEVNNQNNDCYVDFSLDGNYVYGWTQGGTAPYTYTWSDGSTGNVLDVTGYAPGTHTLCLYVTDANGNTCEYCDVITIGENTGDECLDWDVIDLANAPCNFDYNPVCGCDGIEYVNACVAYYCYGITEWTDGPCDYSGGGNGEPTDSTCTTTAEFFYYGELNADGGYDLFFFGFGENTDGYFWDMGDGSTYSGEFVEHTYAVNAQDTIQAYTVCLTTLSDLDSCAATICETIVLDSTPGGFIGGEVVDGEQFTGGNQGDVERVTTTEGDPLSGITVELLDANGNVITSTTTNDQGEYAFSGLQFGDYFVHVNIDGVEHTPDHIQLRPILQNVNNNSYEVVGNQVVSGIDGVSFAAGINVSPNPTNGQLNIALELSDNVDIRIVVTDILGKVVQQEVNNYTQGSQLVELDLAELVSGLYMVSLQANGEVYTTKVLKQ